jgi:hypothetical protein
MVTTVKTAPSKNWILLGTAAVFCTAAVFYYQSGKPGRLAREFLDTTAAQNWAKAYDFMSEGEREQLGMSATEFTQFCCKLAASGWPTGDSHTIEEMMPYTAPDAQSDTAWSTKGTHRFSVTFFRPDGSSDLHLTMEYRHDATGEWHPDVLPFVLGINRGTPHSHPVLGLIDALTAIHRTALVTYPLHQRTNLAELKLVQATKKGMYLTEPIQYFH